jgi:tetratricopeptide (TPR) repeat protein
VLQTVAGLVLLVLAATCAQASAQPRVGADRLVKRADAKFDQRDLDGAWTVKEDDAFGKGSARDAREAVEGAIADFTKAIELDAGLAAAYAGRGVMLLAQGKHAEAERDFTRGLALDPGMKALIDKRVDELRRRQVRR